ncbi:MULTISPECIES: hypothetical protein [unclassified Streptomyces]|uniref:hypothetical protein n=1 Tax=unclassified Streptomyces TaxID=2593676 RepID=UPI002DD7F801|nr:MULTISPECIES: hypothetical protein [unclassified Streptomyces]WSA96169.1 hypothetical protein OIE63_34895 [Streptomyces sp. NBC_01795]WSB80582.1 hypothetical protein OHB04_36000 [Streptomyces sp. NBC_01775]WSS11208.1 hypothetical protein OG533_04250 [Streptomyces sp. NBC_01186]WSS39918.1 hypothetical protein OG220_04350 [Streptomyces sp. NBC_01187]
MTAADAILALKDEDYRLGLARPLGRHPAGDPAGEVYVSAQTLNHTCEPSSCLNEGYCSF